MVDRTAADDIAAVFREDAAPIFKEHFHADQYELLVIRSVEDGWGGMTSETAVVESGRCALDVAGLKGGERVADGIVLTETSYVAELPLASGVTTKHVLRINGRTFDVKDVKRGGKFGMFTEVALEEAEAR